MRVILPLALVALLPACAPAPALVAPATVASEPKVFYSADASWLGPASADDRAAIEDDGLRQLGASWTYRFATSGPGGTTASGTLQKTVKQVYPDAVVLELVTTDAAGHVSREDSNLFTNGPLISNGAPPAAAQDDGYAARDLVTVPAGTYKAVSKTIVGGGGMDTSWYVAGIGMVKQLWVSAADDGTHTDTYELVSYHR
jgi:hypothetical protein